MIRQGDILLRPAQVPKDVVVVHRDSDGRLVLAEGETTGHKHKITAERMEIRQTTDGRFYLSLESAGKMTHEDHATITLAPGKYVVEHEREFDWFQKSVRRVLD